MVISYNQNLHFKIHCKKPLETRLQVISSYFDNTKKSQNNINIKIITKICASLYYWKLNQNYSRIPCFVENEIKTTNKICNISKQNMWFFIIMYLKLFLLFSQNNVSKNHPPFPQIFPLWAIPSHIIMIQNQ
jgi:hypothetical protein